MRNKPTMKDQDLVRFGNYLLSDERKKSFRKQRGGVPIKERMAQVTHADIENWKAKKNEKL